MVEMCIEMIAFGMISTLIWFQEKCYNYKGVVEEILDEDEDKNGLAVGSYEAVFCTDICATYIVEMVAKELKNAIYRGIYRDDGLIIFCGHLSKQAIARWLAGFQLMVNELVNGTFFEFTAELWNLPDQPVPPLFAEEENNNTWSLPTWLENVKLFT
jgi:hypothetical protein